MIFFPDLPFFRLFFFSRKKKINTAFQKKRKNGDRKNHLSALHVLQGHVFHVRSCLKDSREDRDSAGPRGAPGSRAGSAPPRGAAGLDPVLTSEAS